jgi:NitT/TauT family transport system substrate-binding protein
MNLPVSIVRRWPALLAAAVVFLNGCSTESADPIRIGLNAWPGYEFLYLAQEKGFYRDEGVDVRLVGFNSLSDARRAYERGQIDGLGTTIVEVLQAREYSKRTPQIVQAIDYSDGADMLLVRPGITNASSLRGARVGVELASVCVFVLYRALEKNGLSLKDVQLVSSDQATMTTAFERGNLDAVVTYPPNSVALLRSGQARRFFTSAEIPGEVVDVIAIEEDVCKRRPGDVERVIRAYHRAIAYAERNPDDAHAIMARREGITPSEFRQTLTDGVRMISQSEQSKYLRPAGAVSAAITAADKALRDSGQIKGANRSHNIINPSFVSASDSTD